MATKPVRTVNVFHRTGEIVPFLDNSILYRCAMYRSRIMLLEMESYFR